MKKLLGIITVAILGVATITSCNKSDDFNYDEYYKKIEQERRRVDSTLNAQKPILEAYAKANFDNPVLDDSTGIWFEILEPATATENPYKYSLTSNGQWVTPIAKVIYTGYLMGKESDPFDQTSQPVEMNIIEASQYTQGLIPAWPIAFRPKTIIFNSKEFHTGLIDGGLQKGNKIRFITPSPYAYDNRSSDKIPANSPLIFEIKVEDIR